MNILHTCPPYLSGCQMWPLYFGKSKKVTFQQYYSHTHTRTHAHTHTHTLQIIYVISEENKLQLFYCSLPVYFMLLTPHLGHSTGGVRVLTTCPQ